MLVLAFDTATPAVTVAVGDAGQVLAQRTVVDARRQGELLAVGIGEVLAEAGVTHGDLDAIVSGTGPGPYTGLRVGLVTARVLGSALGVAAYGVCTLDVIAADAVTAAAGREFLVATDARRKELYWARYSAAGVRLSGPEVAARRRCPPGCRLPARARTPTRNCSASRSRPAIPVPLRPQRGALPPGGGRAARPPGSAVPAQARCQGARCAEERAGRAGQIRRGQGPRDGVAERAAGHGPGVQGVAPLDLAR